MTRTRFALGLALALLFAAPGARAADRITSYNVCYTKLLRGGMVDRIDPLFSHRYLFFSCLFKQTLMIGLFTPC